MIFNVLLKVIIGNSGIVSITIPEWVRWIISVEAAAVEILLLYKLFLSL